MPAFVPTLPGKEKYNFPVSRDLIDEEKTYQKGLREHMRKKQTKEERLYVCAFVPTGPDPADQHVLLVRKRQPLWQAGLLNGVGGKIEERDSVHPEFPPQVVAMGREWLEETGFESFLEHWQEVAMVWGQDNLGEFWSVHFFTYTKPEEFNFRKLLRDHPNNDAGESFELINPWTLPGKVDIIPNLRWLVPLCLYGKHLDLPLKINDIENNN